MPPIGARAIVDVLVRKSVAALRRTCLRRIVIAGGVGANTLLRAELNAACPKRGATVHYPELEFCTDNGAMIAMAAACACRRMRKRPRRFTPST